MAFDALLSASLKRGDTTYLHKFPRLLLSDTEQKIVKWVATYERKYSEAPSVERLIDTEFGIFFTKTLSKSPLPDLFDRAIELKRKEYFAAKVAELEMEMESGGDQPLNVQRIIELGRELSSVSVEQDDSLIDYDRDDLYSDDEPPSVKFGFPSLDKNTGGIQNGEMALVVARTGVGKTFTICDFALRWARAGKKVLLISCEMPPRQLIGRLDAMMGQFKPSLLRVKSDLAELREGRARVETELAKIRMAGGDIRIPRSRTMTMSKIRGLISDVQPDVVIVDGIYLLRAEDMEKGAGDWQKIKAVSNELKQTALDYDIAILGTSQLKRAGKDDGFTLEDIAYGDSMGQDADLVLALARPSGSPRNLSLGILKNRHGEGYGSVNLSIDWETCAITEIAWDDDTDEDDDEE